jgi:hypothetical protein
MRLHLEGCVLFSREIRLSFLILLFGGTRELGRVHPGPGSVSITFPFTMIVGATGPIG